MGKFLRTNTVDWLNFFFFILNNIIHIFIYFLINIYIYIKYLNNLTQIPLSNWFKSLSKHISNKNRLSKRELKQWLMICRSLWNARNRAQFDKMHSHRIAIVQSATSLLEEYQRLASSLPPVKPMGQIMRLTNTLYSFILLFFILPFHLSKLGTSLRWSISCPSSSDTPTFVFLFSSIYFYHFVQKKEKQNTLIFKF